MLHRTLTSYKADRREKENYNNRIKEEKKIKK